VAALVQAIGGLQQLGSVYVWLPVELDDDDAGQRLSGMVGQLLPSSPAARCSSWDIPAAHSAINGDMPVPRDGQGW
jgi:hypothetical protein